MNEREIAARIGISETIAAASLALAIRLIRQRPDGAMTAHAAIDGIEATIEKHLISNNLSDEERKRVSDHFQEIIATFRNSPE